MRGRSIHARAILRHVGAHRTGAPTVAPLPAVACASPNARGFISTCESRSTRTTARRATSSVAASSSSSSKAKSADSGSSASSAPSGGGNSSSSNGSSSSTKSSTLTSEKTPKTSPKANKGKTFSLKSKSVGISPANPPPSSLGNVAWESFFSNDRPLLQHEMLPPKSKRGGGRSQGEDLGNSGPLTGIFSADDSLAAFGKFSTDSSMQWRRRMRSIDPERFGKLIEGLAGTEEETAATTKDDSPTKWLVSSFHPESDRVAVESAKLEEEERIKDEEDEAVQYALERGEDPDAARKLGAEADLIILGEPNGPDPEWSRGVATYLAEHGRAYEAPPVPKAQDSNDAKDLESLFLGDRVSESVYFTDDDPNLMLSHAMVQMSLPLALKWDAIVAKMDATALNDPSKATDSLVDLGRLNAKLNTDEVMLDSTRRKRKKKMRKHKYKKLRKLQRPERQRLKK